MKTFRELVEKKATKPQIIEDLEGWLKVVAKGVEIKDYPNFKQFKVKNAIGMTAFTFKTGRDAKEMMEKLYSMPKYEKLYINWAANSLEISWQELSQKPSDV